MVMSGMLVLNEMISQTEGFIKRFGHSSAVVGGVDFLLCFSVGSAVRDRIRLSDFRFGGFTGRVLCRSHGWYCGSVGGVGAKVQDVFSAVRSAEESVVENVLYERCSANCIL